MKQFSYPNSQFISGTGAPSAGWKLNVFLTGTATLASIWQDAALTVPAANPVVADSNGYLASFYWSGTVDVVLLDDQDNIQDSASGITDDLTIIQQTITELNSNVLAGEATGSGDSILLNLPTLASDFSDLAFFIMRANAANTAAGPTLGVNSMPSRTIKKYGGAALVAGDIVANQNCLVVYNATTEDYLLCNPTASAVLRDGSLPMTGALDMGGQKVANMAAGVLASDAIRLDQMQTHFGTATGTADAMTATIATALALVDGMRVTIVCPSGFSITATPTLTINALATKTIKSATGHSVGFADVQGVINLVYSSALNAFVLMNPAFGADYLGRVSHAYAESAGYGTHELDGSLANRDDYPALWAWVESRPNLYVAEASWSANVTKFSSGDGSTTFRFPDGRGLFFRSWSHGSSVDSGRAIASYQADDNAPHTHSYIKISYTDGDAQESAGAYLPSGETLDTGSSGTEGRPKNVALIAVVRAY